MRLVFAVPDAKYIRQAFLDDSRRLFREVKPRMLLDHHATRAEIFNEVRNLSTLAKAGDVVVVFYAGHGVLCTNCGGPNSMSQYYLVPVDANLNDLKHSGILGEDLRKEIGDLPCTTILILDACYSDSINNDNLLHEMLYESRLVVMSGAGKSQYAVEANGHGYFTRAIVEGMEGKPGPTTTAKLDCSNSRATSPTRCSRCRRGSRSPQS